MDKRIGAQYFTVRDYIKTIEDFDVTCKKLSDIGYKTVQISGTPLGAAEMREVLDKYNMEALTSHRSFDDFVSNLDEIIEYNKTLGIDLCGVGSMPYDAWQSPDGISDFINKVNVICEKLREEDMYFGYHNHAFEFIKYDGKTIFERLVEETNPEICNFIVDTYWLQVGGKNPADEIRKLGKRAMAVHFKDFEVRRDDWRVSQMCEIGRGNLDWDGIIQACGEAGVRWAFVEQDTNHIEDDPFKALSVSYDYLTTKGFC